MKDAIRNRRVPARKKVLPDGRVLRWRRLAVALVVDRTLLRLELDLGYTYLWHLDIHRP